MTSFNRLSDAMGLGARAGDSGAAAPALGPVLVLYGSDGGAAARAAKQITAAASERGAASTRCVAANTVPVSELLEFASSGASAGAVKPLLLAVVSTAGQGDFPANSEEFWHALRDEKPSDGWSAMRFSVFAMGDRHYWPRPEDKHLFCKAGKDLDAKLVELGAERLTPGAAPGIGDDQDEDGWETGYEQWEEQLWAAALSAQAQVTKKPKPKKKTGEDIKTESRYLRGTVAAGLDDESTGAIAASDTLVTKFHGIYQQDDRDLRAEREAQGLEKAYSFLIRIGLPGGICTPEQYLAMDKLADAPFANNCLKLTTRQAFQLHGVLKKVLRKTVQGFHKACLNSLGACGDINRNVLCSPTPRGVSPELHARIDATAKEINAHLLPRAGKTAYHEIYLDKKPALDLTEPDAEPIYGRPGDKPGECAYLPRKFKIAIAVPPCNDVDVFAHDYGLIAIIERDGDGAQQLLGYNVSVGGGMGMSHNNKETYPRLADVIGFISPDKAVEVAEAVVTVQRDFGDRVNRKHARLKYTIEDRGIDWFKGELESRLGYALGPIRPYAFEDNRDTLGWTRVPVHNATATEELKTDDAGALWHYGLFVEHGRVVDRDGLQLKTGLREIAKVHTGDFRLTANQHIIIGNVTAQQRPTIVALLKRFGIDNSTHSGMRLASMACVALPTCGLALAESQRYLPTLVTALDDVLEDAGLREDAIVIRMTGCPNGCARPYLGEIGLVGRAPGIYNLYLGAGHCGERLNKLYKEAVNHDQIIEELSPIIRRYAKERRDGERFGDFTCRAGYVEAQTSIPATTHDRPSGITFHEHTPLW